MSVPLQPLYAALDTCMIADRRPLRRRLDGLRRRYQEGKPIDRGLAQVGEAVEASRRRLEVRRARLPKPDYPEELPVSARRQEIAETIAAHQVVVVAGETGSGKTTQLPKICLELGRGTAGLIGHTQPRRIAARSVANRIAQELGSELGQLVGYKVRFTDRVSEASLAKLMTDGILLAEVQGDPLLEQYDTLIIDEAHERSLNIDFLLGYLKRLLPKRPDLKVIITSATINTEGFSRFFDGAPVVEVSGRTYPVEVRYRPPVTEDEDDRDRDLPEAVAEAVEELGCIDPLGDTLVFLPGEREIREAAESLRKHQLRHAEVIPLFSRLSAAEQDRVFQPHKGRRIVLATNVAETSLTVPGIRFVVDTGLARISRYSYRTKVQRLPVEPIAQASANQRAGRCGRVSAGVCIRLYSEEDFAQRPLFTDPEIRRTNLASVILQMAAMGLGEVEEFPFMDPPDRRFISDGYRLLHELGAMDERRRLTPIGRQLVRLPVDPRIGRMLLGAAREGSLQEVLIIVSALSIQDPRSRPLDAQQKADQAHQIFEEEGSDFLAYLKLWDFFHEQRRHLSGSKLRQLCHEKFLSYVRLREWHDIHGQLTGLARELGLTPNEEPADADAVHRALLTGLLGHIALKEEERRYLGARGSKPMLFPGSSLFKKPPKWIMAAELVETTRLYARTAAAIKPQWVEPLAGHLIKRSYSEPHWEKRSAQVAGLEQVTLYGLPIVTRRKVNFGPIDPRASRELFIRHALVQGEYHSGAPFLKANRELLAEVEALEAKTRRRDLLVDEESLYAFYDARLPEGIYSGKAFERWRREAERENPKLLCLTREELLNREPEAAGADRFPETLAVQGMALPLEYRFEPNHPADGVTAIIPLGALGQLRPMRFEWLVPGPLEEKLIALIKSLPKALRRNFVPSVNFAHAALPVLGAPDRPLAEALGHQLLRMTGVAVPANAWNEEALPAYLRMNFRVVGEKGEILAEGRDLEALQERMAGRVRESLAGSAEMAPAAGAGPELEGLTGWDFGELPESIEVEQHGLALKAFPGLVDAGETVSLRLFESAAAARQATHRGLRRLFMLTARDKIKYLRKQLPDLNRMCLYYSPLGKCEELREEIIAAAVDRVMLEGELPRDRVAFEAKAEAARQSVVAAANEVAATVAKVLSTHHELAKALKGAVAPQRLKAIADLKDELARLIYPGFITATPEHWLRRLPLYLEAARRRVEKLRQDPERDRRLMLDITPLWQRYWSLHDSLKGEVGEEAENFRWLLEELRLAMFAQELKTLQPVSARRLEKRWSEIQRR